MQEACITRWGVLPQGENSPPALLNQYNYTKNMVEPQTWSYGMTSVVICGGARLSEVLYYIFSVSGFYFGNAPKCLAVFTVHDFQFLANVCAHALNSSLLPVVYISRTDVMPSRSQTQIFIRFNAATMQNMRLTGMTASFPLHAVLSWHWGSINIKCNVILYLNLFIIFSNAQITCEK